LYLGATLRYHVTRASEPRLTNLSIAKPWFISALRIGYFNYYLIAFQAIKTCPDFGKEALQLQNLALEQ